MACQPQGNGTIEQQQRIALTMTNSQRRYASDMSALVVQKRGKSTMLLEEREHSLVDAVCKCANLLMLTPSALALSKPPHQTKTKAPNQIIKPVSSHQTTSLNVIVGSRRLQSSSFCACRSTTPLPALCVTPKEDGWGVPSGPLLTWECLVCEGPQEVEAS